MSLPELPSETPTSNPEAIPIPPPVFIQRHLPVMSKNSLHAKYLNHNVQRGLSLPDLPDEELAAYLASCYFGLANLEAHDVDLSRYAAAVKEFPLSAWQSYFVNLAHSILQLDPSAQHIERMVRHLRETASKVHVSNNTRTALRIALLWLAGPDMPLDIKQKLLTACLKHPLDTMPGFAFAKLIQNLPVLSSLLALDSVYKYSDKTDYDFENDPHALADKLDTLFEYWGLTEETLTTEEFYELVQSDLHPSIRRYLENIIFTSAGTRFILTLENDFETTTGKCLLAEDGTVRFLPTWQLLPGEVKPWKTMLQDYEVILRSPFQDTPLPLLHGTDCIVEYADSIDDDKFKAAVQESAFAIRIGQEIKIVFGEYELSVDRADTYRVRVSALSKGRIPVQDVPAGLRRLVAKIVLRIGQISHINDYDSTEY